MRTLGVNCWRTKCSCLLLIGLSCIGKSTATGGVLLAGFENRTRHLLALSGCWYNLLAEGEHNLNVGFISGFKARGDDIFMPTDDTAISLESVAFEYLRGSAPRISIQATVTQDAGIAVELNREPYAWSTLEMLEVTMGRGWLWEPSWPGLPKEAQALSIHTPLFTLWIWAEPGGRLDQPRRYYRPTLGLRLLPDASQPHITSGLLGSILGPGGGPATTLAFVEAEAPVRQLAYTAQTQASAVPAAEAWVAAVAGPWGSPSQPSLYAGANFTRDWELNDF